VDNWPSSIREDDMRKRPYRKYLALIAVNGKTVAETSSTETWDKAIAQLRDDLRCEPDNRRRRFIEAWLTETLNGRTQ
jgi:hypothetical protein